VSRSKSRNSVSDFNWNSAAVVTAGKQRKSVKAKPHAHLPCLPVTIRPPEILLTQNRYRCRLVTINASGCHIAMLQRAVNNAI
jgi:hypothetical protein